MNKVEKIKAEIERLKNELIQEAEKGYKSEFDEGRISAFEDMITFIDSLEQPIKRTPADIEAAMQEVEEKSKLFTEAHKDDVVSNDTIDALEEAAWTYYDKNKPLIPHELDLHKEMISFFIAGAQWQKEQDQSTIELAEDHAMLAGMEKMKQEIIDKAMVWLTSNMKWGVVSWDDKEQCVWDFKKAMEE